MKCDKCKSSLPFDDYTTFKTTTATSEDNTLIDVSGNMPEDTNVTIINISKEEAIKIAQTHMNIKKDNILYAYDISLTSETMKYQPQEYNKSVKVELSNIEIDKNKNYAMLHITDNNNYEIIPVEKIGNNKISFEATSFSTYILITVEGHTVTFTGENYKVYDIKGNEITNEVVVASGTDFKFTIDPIDEYGVTDITCVNSSAESVIAVSGYIKMKMGLISSVTEDLTIDVTTVIAPKITSQPVSQKVKIGGNASLSLTAENATTYQWQYRDGKDSGWTNVSTSEELSVTVSHSIAKNREYRCLIGNDNFNNHERVSSDIVRISVTEDDLNTKVTIINNEGVLPPVITSQPVSVKAQLGSTATFTVTAENATTYQWQYRDSKDNGWTNLSSTTSSTGSATLSVNAQTGNSAREYRCLVGNSDFVLHSRKKSDTFVLIVVDDGSIEEVTYYNIGLTKQPESQKIKIGETATFSIEETVSNKYQWQYKTSMDDEEWLDVDATLGTSYNVASGFTTKTLTIDTSNMTLNEETLELANSLNGYVFRCVVTSATLSRVFENSDVAFLAVTQDEIVKENIRVQIQPPIISAKINNYAGEEYTGELTNKSIAIELTNKIPASVYKYEWSTNLEDGYTSVNLITTSTGVGRIMLSKEIFGTIYFRTLDEANNSSEVSSIEVKIDKTSPTGSINIKPVLTKGEAKYTNSSEVEITVEGIDNYSKPENLSVALINESDYNNMYSDDEIEWISFAEQKTFTLTAGEGVRKVYAILKDEAGNQSMYITD